jgi:hypothetical protein
MPLLYIVSTLSTGLLAASILGWRASALHAVGVVGRVV